MLPSDAWFDLAEECSCNAEHFAATHPIEDADPLVREARARAWNHEHGHGTTG